MAPAPPIPRLQLLQGFELQLQGARVELPVSGQRVLAFLALHERPLNRIYVAAKLWLDASESRANGCLRTALWRLKQPSCPLIEASSTHVALSPRVDVDFHEVTARARQVLRGGGAAVEPDVELLTVAGELLPDWYEDWVLVERERFRQLRRNALETLCEELTRSGRFTRAIDVGFAAVADEPLRESAHRALISAYLAQGNAIDAINEYCSFRRLLQDELGLAPSPQLEELVGGLPVA